MIFKEIALYPSTYWKLHVYVTIDEDKLRKVLNKKYSYKYEDHIQVLDMVTNDVELKSDTTKIILTLNSLDPPLIAHELVHVLWRYSKLSGVEMNYKSQEWQACFTEYLYNEIVS